MTDYTKLVAALRLCARWHMADDSLANAEQAADAIEALQEKLPKRGEWIKDEEKSRKHVEAIYTCSACHNFDAWGVTELYPYCPNCGADMRKMEVQDGE